MDDRKAGRVEKARFGFGLVSLMAVSALLCLVIWAAIVPLFLGWTPVAVLSGSMAPDIDGGDVVVTQPHNGAGLGPGTVIVFENPAGPRKITHRIVGVDPSGHYVTKGDRNPHIDSDLVAPSQVYGVGRLLVPFVGKPYQWANEGHWPALALTGVAIVMAMWASRWAVLRKFDPWREEDEGGGAEASPTPTRSPVTVSRADYVALIVMALLVANITGVGSKAAFAATTTTAGNSWTADVLAAPTGVSATGGASVTLDWTATVDTYATGHRVYRATSSGGPYSQVAQVTPRTTETYVDSPADGTYYYVLRAYYSNWESVNSTEVSATVSTGIAFDAESSTAGTTDTLTWDHTVGSGSSRILVVGLSFEAQTINNVSYDGQNLTSLGGRTDGDGTGRIEMWYLVDPPVGTATVQVDIATSTPIVAGATSWSGVHQTTPFGSFVTAAGMSTTASVNVSSASDEVVVDVVANIEASSLTVDPSQTPHWNGTQSDIRGGGSSEDGASTTTMSWTMSNQFWVIGAVPLKPVS